MKSGTLKKLEACRRTAFPVRYDWPVIDDRLGWQRMVCEGVLGRLRTKGLIAPKREFRFESRMLTGYPVCSPFAKVAK